MSDTPATPTSVADFQQTLAAIHARIAAASQPGQHVRLLPVSKTVPAERLRQAIAAGCTHVGENKVQEVAAKAAELSDTRVEWSVIGHLQTNKAKYVARLATEFQALDSLKVAQALQQRLEIEDRVLDVFIQVNTSGEPQKFGVDPQEVALLLEQIQDFSRLHVVGLMTLAVFHPNPDIVRPCFERLRLVQEKLAPNVPDGMSLGQLSMGMSGDFELAIKEGSTCVRIGQAIFGARPTAKSPASPSPNLKF